MYVCMYVCMYCICVHMYVCDPRRLTSAAALQHPWIHKDVTALQDVDLTHGATELRKFMARRRFRAGRITF